MVVSPMHIQMDPGVTNLQPQGEQSKQLHTQIMAESGKMTKIRLVRLQWFRQRLLGQAIDEFADVECSTLVNMYHASIDGILSYSLQSPRYMDVLAFS